MIQVAFNYSDIEALCDERVLSVGRALWRQGDVRNTKIQEQGLLVTGDVRDGRPVPYNVLIRATPGKPSKIDGRSRPSVDSLCSCSVGTACKHVVALCLEALDQNNHGGRRSAPATNVSIGEALKTVSRPRLDDVVSSMPAAMRSTLRKPASLHRQAEEANEWIKERGTRPDQAPGIVSADEKVCYIINAGNDQSEGLVRATHTVIRPVVGMMITAAEFGKTRPITLSQLSQGRTDYITAEDKLIGEVMTASIYANREEFRSPPGDPEAFVQLMTRVVATGRCYLHNLKSKPLTWGETKTAKVGWRLEADGAQSPAIVVQKNASTYHVLAASQPFYVNKETNQIGPLTFNGPISVVLKYLAAPKLQPADVVAARARLAKDPFASLLEPPRSLRIERRTGVMPTPNLRLMTSGKGRRKGAVGSNAAQFRLLHHFEYDEASVEVRSDSPTASKDNGDSVVIIPRNPRAEADFTHILSDLPNLSERVGRVEGGPEGRLSYNFVGNDVRLLWLNFLNEYVPKLKASGWKIEIDEGFADQFATVEPDQHPNAWDVDIKEKEGGAWWFSLDLGIIIDGQRTALLPLLMQALKRLSQPSPEAIEGLALSGKLYVDLPDGRALALPFDRVRDIMTTLLELYDQPLNKDGSLNVSIDLAAALSRIETATQMRWLGGSRLNSLLERLKNFDGLTPVSPPLGLKATLRPYQREGLNWLQFLRDYNLGGILADDMGLGKTVQTLAHILIEKKEQRITHPCLIVCPTSLIPNWQDEAAKFAPELKVLSLHGKDRSTRFNDIAGADLVLTTYPLLTRDSQVILPQEWHLVVLDEAQAIKNPTAQVTQLVCEIKGEHRLCLTGTPIENHLGEVWSHFTFLMPGMLGTYKDFNRRFRVPIEKHKDDERRLLLARRLKPFILRRNKSDVAKELPPKTEIIHYVEFDSAQRDLYETVRLTMHDRVQEAVESKGFNKSRIVILDALLKLRQACCDPRLVKLTAAKKVTESAKLESLMDMLPEMIEEGRRILLFSQFTSMLDLIKPELVKAQIPFVELRGDTSDRKTPVADFQEGKIPLFLISLKAGGTGLNLTAADTVIHYDPWWNPAVENQATDRAHRIGQAKTVFVYKFIAKGTVEERILELQTHKSGFATSLLDERKDSGAAFEVDDLSFLFQTSETQSN